MEVFRSQCVVARRLSAFFASSSTPDNRLFAENFSCSKTVLLGSSFEKLEETVHHSDEIMCGIAGIIDLGGQRPAPEGVVQRMARALHHRGPDEEGFLERRGISLASRRLSIVDLAEGQQPMTNEDQQRFRGLQR